MSTPTPTAIVDQPRGRSCPACHLVGVIGTNYVCRLNPPTVVIDPKTDLQVSLWPVVLTTDWCAEFRNVTPPSGVG